MAIKSSASQNELTPEKKSESPVDSGKLALTKLAGIVEKGLKSAEGIKNEGTKSIVKLENQTITDEEKLAKAVQAPETIKNPYA